MTEVSKSRRNNKLASLFMFRQFSISNIFAKYTNDFWELIYKTKQEKNALAGDSRFLMF